MIKYKIKPRLIKRWFRKSKLIFELIQVENYVKSIGKVKFHMEEETVIFKSEDLEEVKNIKESLENLN